MSATSPGRHGSPLPFLAAATAAVGLCALVATAGGGRSAHRAGPPAATLAARSLSVQEGPAGVDVRLAGSGALVQHLPLDTDSFVRGVFHSLTLLRRSHGVAASAPYRLAELSDGELLLSDPATGTRIDLEGFGPNNRAAFLALLGLTVSGTRP